MNNNIKKQVRKFIEIFNKKQSLKCERMKWFKN